MGKTAKVHQKVRKGSPKVANTRRSERRQVRYTQGLKDRISRLNKELKGELTPRQMERRTIARDKAERLLAGNPGRH